MWGALFVNSYLLLSFLFGDMGTLKAIKLKKTYAQLRQEIAYLKKENERLSGRIKALKTDPYTIESLARNQLGLARRGELIYEFFDSVAP